MIRSLRHLALALALSSALAPATAAALSPGSPEAYMASGHESYAAGYWSGAATDFRQASMLRPDDAEAHFMLAAALAKDGRWEEARASFAQAAILRPDLQGDVDAWLAAAPGAAPPAAVLPGPDAGPAPAPAPAPGGQRSFAVGDAVEVMYREGFWIPGVVTASDYPGACPYYRVRADAYGRSDPSELGYGCSSVRAPTGVAAPVAECGGSNPNCPPTSPPPAGAYVCTQAIWQGAGANPAFRNEPRGTITLMPGGRYRMYANGAVGGYRYDATTHRIAWSGGDMDGRGAAATFGLDGTSPEITVEFAGAGAPVRWQCGLGR